MKTFADEFKRAALAVILLTILLGGIYPLAIWGIGQLFFPEKANGSLLKNDREITGSALIGQPFAAESYFHSRPSAIGYASSAVMSGGSNLGPLSKSLYQQVAKRTNEYRKENRLADAFPIAADAVSASASGLDPHISPANAKAQASRVARARGLSEEQVLLVIQQHLEDRQFGFFGEKRVNVLLLNLALNEIKDVIIQSENGPGKSE
jgi:K+-transporting ATPase ATPase C chain